MPKKGDTIKIDLSEIDSFEENVIRINDKDLLFINNSDSQSSSKKPSQNDHPRTSSKTLVDIILLIDTSGSMGAADYSPNRLEAAKEAARMFTKRKVMMNYQDRVGVVGFGGSAQVVHSLDSNLEAVMKSIDRLSITHTGTNIGAAIKSGMSMFKKSNGKKAVVLLSDGADKFDSSNPEQLAKNLNGIRIFTIGVGTVKGGVAALPHAKQTVYLNEDRLKKIAKTSGGRYLYAPSVRDLQNIYIELADY